MVLAALFASGTAALIYEVCWIRKASLVFGSTTFALSTVVAVFFLGMAAGSCVFGRVGPRLRHPLRVFGLLEVSLGVFALFTPVFFGWADALYGVLYRADPAFLSAHAIARAGLVGMIVFPPAVIMGATLPLYCRCYAEGVAGAGRRVGGLYGLNTLGAAVGAATAGFLLLPHLGLARSLQIAAGLSVLFGGLVLVIPFARRAMAPVRKSPEGGGDGATSPRALVLILYFAVGFTGLGLQVVWFRFLSLVIRNTVYTYTLVLTVVLLGIVLGSWLAAWLMVREARIARVFGGLQVLSALSVAGLMALPASLWWSLGSDLRVCALLLLIPSVLGGASFPVAVRLVMGGRSSAAGGAGYAAAANTLGGVLGALTLGFAVLPHAGLQTAIWLTTFPGLLVGTIAWWGLDPRGGAVRKQDSLLLAGALALWFAFVWPGQTRLPVDFLTEPGGGELVDYREGYGANLAVVRRGAVQSLEIDRWWQGEDQKNHQALSAHIPALLHAGPEDVLLVGVGTGQTASRFLMHGIRRLDCIDIEPAIFEFVRRHFDSAWAEDPRTRLIVEDGRLYLRHARGQYDIISLELGQIFRPGVAYFYTAEAYAQAREQLKPGGLLVQFLPLPFFSPDEFRAAVATFLEVFPQSVLWYNTAEVLLIGANADTFPWRPDFPLAAARLPDVFADLDFAYWGGAVEALRHPAVFAGGFLAGPEDLARIAAGGGPLRDDRPWLDYATAGMHALEGREIVLARHLRDHLSPLPAGILLGEGEDLRLEALRIQQQNLGDIAASALLRQAAAREEAGEPTSAQAALEAAMEWNPGNAEVRIRLGEALLRQNRLRSARDHFREAVRILPEELRALRGLAFSFHRDRAFGEAIAVYRLALERHPENSELHNNFGAALAESGQLAEARQHFAEAVRLQPGYHEAERNLARIESLFNAPAPVDTDPRP